MYKLPLFPHKKVVLHKGNVLKKKRYIFKNLETPCLEKKQVYKNERLTDKNMSMKRMRI